MAAQVAQWYVNIRMLEARLQITRGNAKIQQRSLQITERLFLSGNSAELDVQQAKTQYLSTLSTIPQLETSLAQSQNALSALLARKPGLTLEAAIFNRVFVVSSDPWHPDALYPGLPIEELA